MRAEEKEEERRRREEAAAVKKAEEEAKEAARAFEEAEAAAAKAAEREAEEAARAYEASQRPPWYAFLKCLVPTSQQAGGADAGADSNAADGRKTVRFEESREEMERRAAISIQRKYRGRSQQLSLRIRLSSRTCRKVDVRCCCERP